MTQQWKMDISLKPGIRLVTGNLPAAGTAISLTSPWGKVVNTLSGSKPEYGIGGFSFDIWAAGIYTIAFLGQTFQINISDNVTMFITFSQELEPPTSPSPDEDLIDLLAQLNGILARIQVICGNIAVLLNAVSEPDENVVES